MAATRGVNPVPVITTAQLKDTLRTIFQNSQNLSTYKSPVLHEIWNYLIEVDKRWVSTNPQRLQRVKNILNHISDHDLLFLSFVIDQTLDIENEGSSLRDKVGRAAADQFMRAFTGTIQCLLLLATMYFAVKNFFSDSLQSAAIHLFIALACLSLILVADHLYSAFSSGLKKNDRLPTSLMGIIKEISKTKVRDVLTLPLQMADKTIAETVESINNTGSNIRDTARAQLLFFRQAQENQRQRQQQAQANAANPVNPSGQPAPPPPPPPAVLKPAPA